jgi:leucyl-tRNA synthetase
LVNLLYQREEEMKGSNPFTLGVLREALESVVILLAPIVPHICEELWEMMGHTDSITKVPWPEYEPEAIRDEEVLMVIQVNGKLRGRIIVGVHASEDEVRESVLGNPRVQELLKDQPLKKFVLVPRRLVNLVV